MEDVNINSNEEEIYSENSEDTSSSVLIKGYKIEPKYKTSDEEYTIYM